MFCPRCGRPVAPEAAFCASCGAPLRVPEPAPAGAAPWLAGESSEAAAPAWAPAAPPPAAWAPTPEPVLAAPTVRYAGFWIRAVAYLIDAIVLLPVTWTIDRILGVDTEAPFSAPFLAAACFQAIAWLAYCMLLESSDWQGTVGKLALGLRVTDTAGKRISIPRAAIRHLAKYLSLILLLIGFLMIAVQERKRGLHDLIAGTLVVRRRSA